MPTKAVSITKYEKEILKLPVAITIKDAEDMAEASKARAHLKALEKAADNEKQKVLKPLNAARKAEQDRWKPLEDKIDAALSVLDKEMTLYRTEQIRLVRVAEEKLAAKVQKGTLRPETAVAKMDALDRPEELDNTGFRPYPCFEVMDMTLLPIEYHMADEQAIRTAMKSGTQLAGVRYWTEQRPYNTR